MDDLDINGSMQFDPRNLIAEVFVLYCDILNVVVGNGAEHAAHMPYDSILPAVIDGIIPDDMGAGGSLVPSNPPP